MYVVVPRTAARYFALTYLRAIFVQGLISNELVMLNYLSPRHVISPVPFWSASTATAHDSTIWPRPTESPPIKSCYFLTVDIACVHHVRYCIL
jgi:hypothetical protein